MAEKTNSLKRRALSSEESHLQTRIKEVIDYYIRNYYPSRFEIIKAKNLFAGDEKIAVMNTLWQSPLSTHRHWLIDSTHDAFSKELLNQNYTPQVLPMHPSYRERSHRAQAYYDLTYQLSWFEKDVAEKLYTEASLIGDSYVFFGSKELFGKNVSHAEHISFFEMFAEPMATSFESSRIKIIRKIMSTNDVLWKFWSIIDFDKKTIDTNKKMNDWEVLLSTYDNCIYKTDFKKLYDIASYESRYIEEIDRCCNGVDTDYRKSYNDILEKWTLYESLFWFSEDSRLHEVIELREIIEWKWLPKIMIDWYLFTIKSDVSFNYFPFGNVYYEENIGSPVHRWIGHKLIAKQKECDMYLFIITNWVKMHSFPDWITDWWVSDSNDKAVVNLQWTGEQKVYKNSNKNIQGKQPFRPIDYVDKDVLNLVRLRLQETEQSAYSDIGINSYILWTDGRVERLSWAFKERTDQSRARLKTVKKSVSDALNKSYYIWLDLIDPSFAKKLIEVKDWAGNITYEDLNIKEIRDTFTVVIASEGQRQDSLATQWQNILNTLNAFWEFIASDPNLDIDKKSLADAVASTNGLEWLKFLTPEERIAKKKLETETMIALARIELEWQLEIEKMKQELMPQQPQVNETQNMIENWWEIVTDAQGNIIPQAPQMPLQ